MNGLSHALKLAGAGAFQAQDDALVRENLRARVHLLENSKGGVIFVRDSFSVFECPLRLKSTLGDFLKGRSRKESCRRYGAGMKEFTALLQFLAGKIKNHHSDDGLRPDAAGGERALDRLVLNISNACNLTCSYCYAEGGSYGHAPSLMTQRTAAGVLEKFFKLFRRVGRIQFFGGEPLLNIKLIRFVCDWILEKHRCGGLPEIPRFGVVTNGTILSREALRTLKEFQVSAVVSLDGPPPIHDELRGHGTSARISRFVAALDAFGIPYSFEATCTARHIERGFHPRDLMDYFFQVYRQNVVHIAPVSLPSGHPLRMGSRDTEIAFRGAMEYSLSNLQSGQAPVCLSFASRMMKAFLGRQPMADYCPAGRSTLSVDSEGRVYPCFMFSGRKDFEYGSALDSAFPDLSRACEISDRLGAADKSGNSECRDCWAQPLCFGCLGADLINNDGLSCGRIKRTGCDTLKAMAEGFLSNLANLRDTRRSAAWQRETDKEVMDHAIV